MGFKMKGWKAYDTTDHSNNTPDGRAGSSAFQQGVGGKKSTPPPKTHIPDYWKNRKPKEKLRPGIPEKPGRGGVLKPTKRQLIDMSKKFKKPKSSPMKQGYIKSRPKISKKDREGLSEMMQARRNQTGPQGGKRSKTTKSKITGPTKTTGPSKITRSKTFNPKLKPIKKGKDLWDKMDKDSPRKRIFGDKEKSPLKKDKEPKFTPGNVLRVLRDEYKRAFGKGWRKKYQKKK